MATPPPILEVDGALRGVVLAQATHRIELRYRPASAHLGAATSAIGFLAALWFQWDKRFRLSRLLSAKRVP